MYGPPPNQSDLRERYERMQQALLDIQAARDLTRETIAPKGEIRRRLARMRYARKHHLLEATQ